MEPKIAVEVPEELLPEVIYWANYFSISPEDLVAHAVELYLRKRDEQKTISEARAIYTTIKSEDLAIAEAYTPLINESLSMMAGTLPRLRALPKALPLDNAVRLELEEGVLIFRAPSAVQERIEHLLDKQKDAGLTQSEEQELDLYEEIDDYLSFVNRTVRDRSSIQPEYAELS